MSIYQYSTYAMSHKQLSLPGALHVPLNNLKHMIRYFKKLKEDP